MNGRWRVGWLVCYLALLPVSRRQVCGQFSDVPEPASAVSAADRLAIEQIAQLVDVGQFAEAMTQLDRLMDLPPALVATGPQQAAGTQRVQAYLPVSQWSCQQQQRVIARALAGQLEHRQQRLGAAQAAYRGLQQSKSTMAGRDAVIRYRMTEAGPALVRLLADVFLEQGQALAAVQMMEACLPELMRVDLSQFDARAATVQLPWHVVYTAMDADSDQTARLLKHWRTVCGSNQPLAVDLLIRQLTAAAMEPQYVDYEALGRWAEAVVKSEVEPAERDRLTACLQQTQAYYESATWTVQPSFTLDHRPAWQLPLTRWASPLDVTPASQPRVGQGPVMLPIIVAQSADMVFLHELTRVRAIELHTGTVWPDAQTGAALFDTRLPQADYLPAGYPVMGQPKGELTVDDGCLYARMGSPITAWANRSRASDGSSLGYLIGLDLDSQGRQLRGFPLRLVPPQFVDAELEGRPVVWQQLLITGVVERDNSGIRRSLAAFDRYSGQLEWRSAVLGSGVVVGSERANLIAATGPIVAGGLLYYATDLGTIACLDPHSGRTLWQSCYRRRLSNSGNGRQPDRYRYRDGQGCFVQRGLVYCLPQDAPELFALDALSGNLLWSSQDIEFQDATYIVGAVGQTLLVGGDRLIWVDRCAGRILESFPEPTTPGLVNALPQPRGMGQAALVGQYVCWPTAEEIIVFSADLAGQSRVEESTKVAATDHQPFVRRFQTGALTREGARLSWVGEHLLLTTPDWLYCFRAQR
ncbi:MAG: PQQ-binding-like beta-propeller repeat protein [Pirellulaceae bacterium]|nr:PQQ-binding-like beta-propeller repeat protein [Pirellulaceae bacterium]